MADFTLKSGREIVFDWDMLTLKEYRVLASSVSKEETDPLFCRVINLTIDELEAIPYREFRKLRTAFWKAANAPLTDPN